MKLILLFGMAIIISILGFIRIQHYLKIANSQKVDSTFYMVASFNVGSIIFVSFLLLMTGITLKQISDPNFSDSDRALVIIALGICPSIPAIGIGVATSLYIWKSQLKQKVFEKQKTDTN